MLPEFRSEPKDDIEVYYVFDILVNKHNPARPQHQSGQSYFTSAMKAKNLRDLVNSVIISGDPRREEVKQMKDFGMRYVLSHEILHVLLDDGFHIGQERIADADKAIEKPTAIERTNILVSMGKAIFSGTITDSRRISQQQGKAMVTEVMILLHTPS